MTSLSKSDSADARYAWYRSSCVCLMSALFVTLHQVGYSNTGTLKVLVIKPRVGLAPIYTIPTAQSRCSGFTCDIPVVSVFCHCGYVTFRLNRFYNLLHVQLRLFMGTFFFHFSRIPPKKPPTKQTNKKKQPKKQTQQQQTSKTTTNKTCRGPVSFSACPIVAFGYAFYID